MAHEYVTCGLMARKMLKKINSLATRIEVTHTIFCEQHRKFKNLLLVAVGKRQKTQTIKAIQRTFSNQITEVYYLN